MLLSGLLVYWFYRPNILLFEWLSIQPASPLAIDSPFSQLMSFYYADVAWCLAIALMIPVLKRLQVSRGYCLSLLALPFVSEFFQAVGILPGYFDWVDLTLYFLITLPTVTRELRLMFRMDKNVAGSVAIVFFTFAMLASSGTPKKPPPAPAPATPPPEKVWLNGTFFLTPQANDVFTKSELIKTLNLSSSPSIVLRVPNPGSRVTVEEKQKNSVLYNLIEKEFAKSGFVVRDRQLFAKVLEQETEDYSSIGLITETDFILELLSYDLNVKTETKNYIDENGEPAEAPYQVKFNSAIAEFKLISVKKNDLVGAYTFHYTPCQEGCEERFDPDARSWSVDNPIPTDFFKGVARELVKELGYLR